MTLSQNLILFSNRYGNLQEMLEMASFVKYVDLYLTSEWGRFYVEHPVLVASFIQKSTATAVKYGGRYFPVASTVLTESALPNCMLCTRLFRLSAANHGAIFVTPKALKSP
jgi:hypothetical protein